MPSKTVTIEKNENGIYTINAGNGTTKLENPNSFLCLKMEGNQLKEDTNNPRGGVRTEITFKDTDKPLHLNVEKPNGVHILKVIGSEDFRDARESYIPTFLIQEHYVTISVDDCREKNGDKLLVIKTF